VGNIAGVRKAWTPAFFFGIVSATVVACRSLPPSPSQSKYVVTSAPLSLSVPSRPLCVAVDPDDAHGVWWWEPGESGCASKSTGPGVFHAENASVARYKGSQAIELRFRIPLHGPPDFVDVALTVENGRMRSRDGAARVAVEHRGDLNVPDLPPHLPPPH
jgi:hypothetical protein